MLTSVFTRCKQQLSCTCACSFWIEQSLQFPIEAAVTSLRPDVVLFLVQARQSSLLELTVPLEDNVHLAHDRKTTKYSALVTACEGNGFKTHMFALEVGCLGYCPHSFLHCFEALGLPKSAARQIRSEASKTALRSSYVLFFAEACRLGSVKLFFTEPCSRHVRFVFFLSSFAFPFSASHRSHPETTRFRFQAYTQHLLAFRILQLSDVDRTVTVLNCVLQFSRASLRIKAAFTRIRIDPDIRMSQLRIGPSVYTKTIEVYAIRSNTLRYPELFETISKVDHPDVPVLFGHV